MAQNVLEKITQACSLGLPAGHEVTPGDVVRVRPAHVMTHDNTSAVIPKFRAIGAARIHDPGQPVIAIDHDIQNTSPENLARYARIEVFAKEHGIAFFPARSGISHQIMAEEGFVLPGSFVVGSDSHSNLYGALGAVGTPVVRTDAAAIWATGETWWEVPPVAPGAPPTGTPAGGRGGQGRHHLAHRNVPERRGPEPRRSSSTVDGRRATSRWISA